jgi:hypothetical protein
VKWFVGLGPRPAFDRFTHWEKFDAIRTTAPPRWLRVLGYAIGTAAIITGLTMVSPIVVGLMR